MVGRAAPGASDKVQMHARIGSPPTSTGRLTMCSAVLCSNLYSVRQLPAVSHNALGVRGAFSNPAIGGPLGYSSDTVLRRKGWQMDPRISVRNGKQGAEVERRLEARLRKYHDKRLEHR